MPIDEIAEVGLRIGLDMAGGLIEAAGHGRQRSAAVVRAVLWFVGLLLCAGLLWLQLQPSRDRDALALAAGVVLTAVAGGWMARQLAADVRLLRYWGEPNVTASDKGLLIPGHKLVAWADIASITTENRRRREHVCITCSGKSGRNILIPSSNPTALAKALLAEKAYHT